EADRARRPRVPCCVLHRMGFFVPRRLLAGRWALTPPFHPYLAEARRFIFCDTFRHARLSTDVPAHFTRHAAWRCSDFPLPGTEMPNSDHLTPKCVHDTAHSRTGKRRVLARRCTTCQSVAALSPIRDQRRPEAARPIRAEAAREPRERCVREAHPQPAARGRARAGEYLCARGRDPRRSAAVVFVPVSAERRDEESRDR